MYGENYQQFILDYKIDKEGLTSFWRRNKFYSMGVLLNLACCIQYLYFYRIFVYGKRGVGGVWGEVAYDIYYYLAEIRPIFSWA